jgi:hypothetical protein
VVRKLMSKERAAIYIVPSEPTNRATRFLRLS